jgi:hypothetical protein
MKIGLIIVVTNMLNMLNMINIVQPTWKFDGISLILIYVDGSSWTLMASKCFNHQNPSKSIKIYENPLFHGVNFFQRLQTFKNISSSWSSCRSSLSKSPGPERPQRNGTSGAWSGARLWCHAAKVENLR